MATRGTYQINDITLYNHWDNYPEGAAVLFEKMLLQSGCYNLTAEAFLRANKNSGITKSHKSHTDTEYRYTLIDNVLTAHSGFDDNWTTIFTGTIFEFINKYRTITNYQTGISEIWCQEWYCIENTLNFNRSEWHCDKTIKAEIKKTSKKIRDYAETWRKDNFLSNANTISALETIEFFNNIIKERQAKKAA